VDWTDYARSDEHDAGLKPPSHRLDYEGLVQAAEMIERIRQEGRDPKGERATTCPSEEGDYDENSQPQSKKSSEEQT